jgi:hypothetical protein
VYYLELLDSFVFGCGSLRDFRFYRNSVNVALVAVALVAVALVAVALVAVAAVAVAPVAVAPVAVAPAAALVVVGSVASTPIPTPTSTSIWTYVFDTGSQLVRGTYSMLRQENILGEQEFYRRRQTGPLNL